VTDQTDIETGEPWGRASEKRGLSHLDIAMEFVKDFPIGVIISAADFDNWAQRHGLLNTPTNAPKRSDAWMAHLHRRHELRYRINRSGSHPRLTELGSTPFSMDTIGQGTYEIRAPQVAAAQTTLPKKIVSLTNNKRKQLAYLMESSDWPAIPPHERAMAESIYDDIENFGELVTLQANVISRKLVKLELKLKRAIELGDIKPSNHGIQQLIAAPEDIDAEDVDGEAV
jgi:hypothetical protein